MPFQTRREASEAFYRVDFHTALVRETSTEAETNKTQPRTLPNVHGTRGASSPRLKVSLLETDNKAVEERDRLRSTLDVLSCLGFINTGVLKLRQPHETISLEESHNPVMSGRREGFPHVLNSAWKKVYKSNQSGATAPMKPHKQGTYQVDQVAEVLLDLLWRQAPH